MKVLVTGDSHQWALVDGFQLLKDEGAIDELAPAPVGGELTLRRDFFAVNDGHLQITAEGPFTRYTGSLIPPAGFDPDLCVVSACFHTAHLLWDYFARAVPLKHYRDGDTLPLTDSLLRAIADQCQHHGRAFLKALRGLGLNVVVAEAPKLFRHNPNLASFRPEVALYFDQLYRDRARQWMRAEGFAWVDAPRDIVADDGFMRDEYRFAALDDIHHANVAFGIIMAQRILAAATASKRP